ncbi:PREDICTED: uncharacterized protein LOC109208260 [Nicotiana attenuata]|uniref:uncharacterized protein LOC109208260 n=1 Tax=Nicotiana attenuata TaxID=49451 RepID=UPI0009052843|nr:PREDICTED: uncharacterized protein LOC109208260 [Nicotiana attenuata]
MEKGEKVDIRVKEYLELAGYEKWARLYAPVNRGWTMTSHIADSINAALVSARELPIYDFLEEVVTSTEYLHTANNGGKHYTVCLLERKCVCGRFQVDKLPCPHAWAILKSKFLLLEDYCSNYYQPNSIVMTYDVPVYLLPDRNEWNVPTHIAEEVVLPPKWKRPPGRPKKKHDKPFSELLQLKNQHSCSICGQGRHNKRTYRNAPHRI